MGGRLGYRGAEISEEEGEVRYSRVVEKKGVVMCDDVARGDCRGILY